MNCWGAGAHKYLKQIMALMNVEKLQIREAHAKQSVYGQLAGGPGMFVVFANISRLPVQLCPSGVLLIAGGPCSGLSSVPIGTASSARGLGVVSHPKPSITRQIIPTKQHNLFSIASLSLFPAHCVLLCK